MLLPHRIDTYIRTVTLQLGHLSCIALLADATIRYYNAKSPWITQASLKPLSAFDGYKLMAVYATLNEEKVSTCDTPVQSL